MNNLCNISSLDKLWLYTKKLHKKHFPESRLEPILAGGRLRNPKYMFVFINPTYRNISSNPSWEGKRRPWTGTKYIWKIFHQAGQFDKDLFEEIDRKNSWDVDFADKVYKHLDDRSFYFTNLVKWTGENADLPNTKKINIFIPILKKEIEIVNPQTIVTFGRIPFKELTGEEIRLGEYYEDAIVNKVLKKYNLEINDRKYNLVPCYFPVGRGNPKAAIKILSMLP
jgi:DNA polymerase